MKNILSILFALAVLLLAASPAAASEQTVNLGDVTVSIEVDDPHFGDPIRPGELVPFGGRYTHDSLAGYKFGSDYGHCPDRPDGWLDRWWWDFWYGEECTDRDDMNHYLWPCGCYCNADGECGYYRSGGSGGFNMAGSHYDQVAPGTERDKCGSRGGSNDYCGTTATSGLPGDELPEPDFDFVPISSNFSRSPLGR